MKKKRNNLLFTSAGDNTNFDELWLEENRTYDVWVVYYGNDDELFERYKSKVDYIEKRKGDKWQNFHHLYQPYKEKILSYDYLFFLDDDIIITTDQINEMFTITKEGSLWITQPSFDKGSELGHGINATVEGLYLRYTNFVENNCPLMKKECVEKFMKYYEPTLIGWGVDFIYLWANGKDEEERYAIIDKIKCINPPTFIKEKMINTFKNPREWHIGHPDINTQYWPNSDMSHEENKKREFSQVKNYNNRKEVFFHLADKLNIKIWTPGVYREIPNSTIWTEFIKRDYSPLVSVKHLKKLNIKESAEDKIAFMFLTRNNLKQPQLWYDFLSDGEGKFNIYAHTKERDKISQRFLKEAQIPEHVHTEWATPSLVTATNLLIKNALKDPTNKYFVLISESCIPLRSFEVTYGTIKEINKSWLYTPITPTKKSRVEGKLNLLGEAMKQIQNPEKLGITKENIMRNSQWMILNRDHAEIIDTYNHEEMWRVFHVADEWYHYNVLKFYDGDIQQNTLQYVMPTFFYYFDYGRHMRKEDVWVDPNPNNAEVHPSTFNLEQILHVKENENSLFLRKVTEDVRIMYNDIKNERRRD